MFRPMKAVRSAILCTSLMICGGAICQPARVSGAQRFEAHLDTMLAASDYAGIEQMLWYAVQGPASSTRAPIIAGQLLRDAGDPPDSVDHLRVRILDWELLQEEHGKTNTAFVGKIYAQTLFAVAPYLDEPQRSKITVSAAGQYIRVLEMIETEGGQCADPAAPAARLREVTRDLQPIRHALDSMNGAGRLEAARYALLLMQFGFPQRVPDRWMCGAAFAPYATWDTRRTGALREWKKRWGLEAIPDLMNRKAPDVAGQFG